MTSDKEIAHILAPSRVQKWVFELVIETRPAGSMLTGIMSHTLSIWLHMILQ